MSVNDSSSKTNLCIKELLIIKDILDAHVADDFCSRLLAIYAMVRVDDITKIWGHTIPKNDIFRTGYEAVLNSYNDNLRKVRDKLGAHYQCAQERLFGSVKLFKSIDYGNTLCLIEQIFDFQNKLTGVDITCYGFEKSNDWKIVKSVLDYYYSDDNATITNGALDLFGVNKGGLISCSDAQAKGQYLRSIEMMVDVSYTLASKTYSDKCVTNLFKRMFVCMVYNYHDNLITRTDINSNSVQYEEGFDNLFLNLITKNDNRKELEQVFSKFESLYQVQAFIKKYKKVRDHACAHLDEQSNVAQIDIELDCLNINDLHDVYIHMLNLFNYICNNVFLLKPIALPCRSRIYDAFIESITDTDDYYGEKPNMSNVKELDIKDIFRSIRKQDKRCEEAMSKLGHFLMSGDASAYDKAISTITNRLKEPKISDNELSAILSALYNSKRGYPERLQHSILAMLANKGIKESNKIHLLWVLSSICVEDKQYDIDHYLDSLVMQKIPVLTGYATLACLHKTVEKTRSCFVLRNRAHEVNEQFVNYCKSLNNVTGTLALLLMMNQRWFHDTEYSYYRSYETYYKEFLEREISIALRRYLSYIKLTDEGEYKIYISYLETKHYLLLLYRLAVKEKERRQDHNVFLELWNSNCFYRTRFDVYEALGVGLMTELSGQIDLARDIFESIVKDNPINKDAIQTLDQFNERHNKLNKS